MASSSFSADVIAIRERARQKMSQGPVTESYGKDTKEVVAILNEVLATEIVCWMRYSRHAISAAGINWLADDDATTRRLIEDIPAEEDEHADDIVDLLGT